MTTNLVFCSTIIPTIGRSKLTRAVQSVLDQDFSSSEFEIIVVNDSGQPLPDAAWLSSERVKIVNTNKRERSIARNTGAAAARGRYLHFLDDDDWLQPNALNEFWSLTQLSQGNWFYGGTQLVDRQGKSLIQLHPNIQGNGFIQVLAGEWIPLQASLIESAAFFEAGGFNPLISGPEDNDICRKVALKGDFVSMKSVVACVEWGEEGSTTNLTTHPEMSRWAREKILSEPGVFPRMRGSADTSYWHGRIVRAYLTSLVWNLRNRQLFTAASRGMFALLGFLFSFLHVLSPQFWKAIRSGHEGEAFRQGFLALEQQSNLAQ